jgi:hypothetical protein
MRKHNGNSRRETASLIGSDKVMGSYGNVEITIICRDGSRLRLAERRDYAPLKGDIFDTADTGQTVKARIDTCHEEKPIGWSHPFFQVTATEI